MLVFLFIAGCATPIPESKNVYTLVSPVAFLEIVNEREHDLKNSWIWAYCGSDAGYDYFYGFIGEVFPGHNHNYTYYKIKTGEIDINGPRFDFPSPDKFRYVLSTPAEISAMNRKFGLTGKAAVAPPAPTGGAATTP